MGLISGIFMGTIVGIVLMAGWRHMMGYRSNKRIAKAADIKLLGSLNRDDLKKICGDNFPDWISFPVYEQVKWLNKQLSKLWPYVSDAATAIIKESVEPLLEEYRPPGITSLKFSKLTLGTVAPKIEEIARIPRISTIGNVRSAVPHRGPSLYIDGKSVAGRKSVLSSCLVGCFDKEVGGCDRVEEWAARAWNTSCGVGVTPLSDLLLLFRFPSQVEAQRVLKEGRRQWGSATLRIDVWSFRVGCCGVLREKGLKQIRLFGLPLHLFVEVGELCGGLVGAVADETRDAESVIF